MLNSYYTAVAGVKLPYKGRQYYMHEYNLDKPSMPKGFEDYLEPVKKLLDLCVKKTGVAYITIDEKLVKAGQTQRKPKPHVDGCFIKDLNYWGHGGGWNHTCNNVPIPRMEVIVASSVPGCKVWEGKFDAEPKDDGDLSHLELGEGFILPANVAYLLSPDCVHESLPMKADVERTFLRIAFLRN